jgi:hypothetical protein
MAASIKDKTDIVLGYSPMKFSQGISAYIAKYETAYIAMQYLSYALKGMSYMGVGRNLMFKKSSFLTSNPYADNMHIASGDDDFVVKAIAREDNVDICIHPNAFTITSAPSDLNQYFHQKTRHISTASLYKNKIKNLLAIFGAAHIMVYSLFFLNIVLLWFPIKVAVGSILFMWSIIIIIQVPIFYKLHESKTIPALPIVDIFLAMFYLLLLPYTILRNKTKWS